MKPIVPEITCKFPAKFRPTIAEGLKACISILKAADIRVVKDVRVQMT